MDPRAESQSTRKKNTAHSGGNLMSRYLVCVDVFSYTSSTLPHPLSTGKLTRKHHPDPRQGVEEFHTCASSQRSASIAAAHPIPAAVTAWRYLWSTQSPPANTPSTEVIVVPGQVTTYPF